MSADPATLEVYRAEAARYQALSPSPSEAAALDTFLGLLPPGGRILDLGCGPGHHAAAMAARGFDVTAWDASETFVDLARAKGVRAERRSFDTLDAEAAYDGIWASFSLLHAPKAAFPRHLSAIARALRPAGHFFLGMKLGSGERRDALGRFYAYFSEADLTEALEAAGFETLHSVTGQGEGLAGTVDPFVLMTARRG
jgi:SAM-dependent methyltransferase